MKESIAIAALAASIILTAGTASAQSNMEKCKAVKDGKGLIKANKADCASSTHSCAGQNKVNDPESWIMVPKGLCDKINAGNFEGVSKDIKDKIEGAK